MFNNDLTLEKVNNEYFKLAKPLIYINNDIEIIVKEDFKTDGASIPKTGWTIFGHPFQGEYIESAIVHDALYSSQILTKEDSDMLFLEMLEEQKVNNLKANLMYSAVKIFGFEAWNSKLQEQILETQQKYIYIKIINKEKYKINKWN